MTDAQNQGSAAAEERTDRDRPALHYATPAGWLNDPNGLVYLDGEYHLFYQHYPSDIVWGPMHWGHAVSRDLLHWQTLPIALAPDVEGQIFSGSAVVDSDNHAGFGRAALVAIFTQHRDGRQAQSLAYSRDRGRSWTTYAGNPVLLPPQGIVDFRDPKVLRYSRADGTACWVMVLAVGQSIWFYQSDNLIRWTKTAEFSGYGAADGVWECPDLLELPIDGGTQTRWVLMVSVAQGAPAGGSGQQYFVGDFDGGRFTPHEPADVVRWADYGADFYAGQSWYGAPQGRKLWLAWLNNWDYARTTPATTWRGVMTLPRDVSLTADDRGYRLRQQPPAEWAAQRRLIGQRRDLLIGPGRHLLDGISGCTLEIRARFALDDADATCCGLHVRVGATDATIVSYDLTRGTLSVDRRRAGAGWRTDEAPQLQALSVRDGVLELRLLVDHCVLEVFADAGRLVMTNQIFPDAASQALAVFAEGGNVRLLSLEAYRPGAQ